MSCDVTINSKLYNSILVQSSSVDSALRSYLKLKKQGWSDDQEVMALSAKRSKDTKFDKLLKAKGLRLAKTQEQLAKVKYSIKQGIKKKENVNELRKRRNMLESRELELTKDIEILEAEDTVQGLQSIFDSDKEYVDTLLNTDSIEDLYTAQAIMDMYKNMGDFSDLTRSDHPLFDAKFLKDIDLDGNVVKTLREWAGVMQNKMAKWNQNFKKRVEDAVNNSTRYESKEKVSYDEIVKALKDLHIIDASVMALGEEGLFGGSSEVAKVIMDYILEDRRKATLEIGNKTKQHRNLLEKAQAALSSMGFKGQNLYQIFKQMHKGKFTGRLASRFSQSFFDKRRIENINIYKNIDKAKKSGDKEKIDKAYRAREKWKRENEILFDIRKLPEVKEKFPSAFKWMQEDEGAHKSELIKVLGERGYQEQLKIQLDRIEIFLSEMEHAKEYFMEKYKVKDINDSAEALQEFEIWERIHSPYWAASYINAEDRAEVKYKGKFLSEFELEGEKAHYRGYEYLSSVPRKFKANAVWNKATNHFVISETNEPTGYYDENFAKIESNEDIYNYYKFVVDSLVEIRNNLPLELQERFETIYDIPLYKKDFIEKVFANGGFDLVNFGKVTKDSFYDGIMDALSDSEESTLQTTQEEFGREREGQNYSFIGDRKAKVYAAYSLKLLDYAQKKGITKEEVPIAVKKQLKLESEEEVSKEHSFDLGKLMEIYIYQAIHAKHREQTLPMLDLLEDAAERIPKIKTNRFGKVISDDEGNPLLDQKKIRNEEIDLVHNALKIHKGLPVQAVEGESKEKVYTTEEKAEMAEIDRLLEGELSESDREKLQERKAKLGKKVTGSGIIDTLLGYLRLLGLGWNLTAMLPNAAAGYFANFIEASDGRIISLQAMKRAYRNITHSTLKLASLGKIQTETAQKIANFMLKADVLLDSTNEFQKAQVNSKLTGGLSYLHPMMLNKVVEYPNQATTAISRLMTIEVDKGITLWDIMDKDMNIKPEFQEKYGEWNFEGKLFQSEIRRIKELIKKIHGDYSEEGRMKMKNKAMGRMAAFFKTWVARTIVNRFGTEDNTTDLGVQKGRYRSYTEGSASLSGAVVGTVFMPGIGTVVGGFGGWLAGKLYGRQSEKKFTEDFFGSGMDLIRKLLRARSKNYNDQFDEVDAANMRANIQELAFLLAMVGTYMIAKLTLWDEDEPAEDQVAHNIIVNQINRVTADLAFFSNPQTPKSLVDQAIPVARIMTNGYRVMTSGLKVMYGKELRANENTFIENFAKTVPAAFRPVFGEPVISKVDMEKEMFPNQGMNYLLYGAE